MLVAEVSDLASQSAELDPASTSLINQAIELVCNESPEGLTPQSELSVEAVYAMYVAIGQHRVRLEGPEAMLGALMGGGNPEQDAQNFLQELRGRVQAGATVAE